MYMYINIYIYTYVYIYVHIYAGILYPFTQNKTQNPISYSNNTNLEYQDDGICVTEPEPLLRYEPTLMDTANALFTRH